jgi:hypothetical protein
MLAVLPLPGPPGVRCQIITWGGSLPLAHPGLSSWHTSVVQKSQPEGLEGENSPGGAQRHPGLALGQLCRVPYLDRRVCHLKKARAILLTSTPPLKMLVAATNSG